MWTDRVVHEEVKPPEISEEERTILDQMSDDYMRRKYNITIRTGEYGQCAN